MESIAIRSHEFTRSDGRDCINCGHLKAGWPVYPVEGTSGYKCLGCAVNEAVVDPDEYDLIYDFFRLNGLQVKEILIAEHIENDVTYTAPRVNGEWIVYVGDLSKTDNFLKFLNNIGVILPIKMEYVK